MSPCSSTAPNLFWQPIYNRSQQSKSPFEPDETHTTSPTKEEHKWATHFTIPAPDFRIEQYVGVRWLPY